MTDGEAKSISEQQSPEFGCELPDFSDIRGVQNIGADANARAADPARREVLRLELEARANRLVQAVDEAIILANDGLIRWLGDPVARIARGEDILTPQAVILAAAELPEAAKEAVAARIDLWLKATTRRLLGPLFALRELREEPAPVRALAQKVAEALGVLDRNRVRGEVQALDQTSRASLRKHGVRFGAYYIYVPTLLKPASRALALQLWSLHADQTLAESPAEKLTPLAASGRTSLPFDPLIPCHCYRVSGFRPCGERVVRVDIVERLADLIRGALACSFSAEAKPKKDCASGFAVNSQMTSLVGCSGKTFESVLRSLGYESFEAKRANIDEPGPRPSGPEREETGENTGVLEAILSDETDVSPHPEQEGEQGQTVLVSVSPAHPCMDAATPSQNAEAPPADAEQQIDAPETERAETDTILLWRPAPKPPRQFQLNRRREQGVDDCQKGKKQRSEDQSRAGGETQARPLDIPDGSGKGGAGPPGRRKRGEKWTRQATRSKAKVREKGGLSTAETVQFDPTSPFAKLLELRALLETEQKTQK